MTPPQNDPASALDAAHTRWFADEVLPHKAQLKAYLRGSFPTVRDVDDVVQESYLRIWRRHLARPIASTRGFLFQVARRLALDALRHERASPLRPMPEGAIDEVPEESVGLAEAACTQDEIEVLFAAIEALPARCREIVILRKIEGVSQKEIARRLGLSEATVQVQACRGLRRCAEYVRKHATARASARWAG